VEGLFFLDQLGLLADRPASQEAGQLRRLAAFKERHLFVPIADFGLQLFDLLVRVPAGGALIQVMRHHFAEHVVVLQPP